MSDQPQTSGDYEVRAANCDNLRFDLIGYDLTTSLRVAFGGIRTAIGWAEMPAHTSTTAATPMATRPGPLRLVLFWTGHQSMTKLPVKASADDIEPLVRAWLDPPDRYGPQPDHDGHNRRGWRVYNESWGHVAGMWEAFAAIEPTWLMFGK